MTQHQQQKILDFLRDAFLRDAGPASRAQIVQATELEGATVSRLLERMETNGLVRHEGRTRAARWSVV